MGGPRGQGNLFQLSRYFCGARREVMPLKGAGKKYA